MSDKKNIVSEFGKVPPNAIDMENAVLGLILIYPDGFNEVMAILKSEMFYKEAHQKIYEACLIVFKRIGKVDLTTVTRELLDNHNIESIGGPLYITKLCASSYSIEMIEHYAIIVKQKYIAREYIRLGSEIQNMAFDESNDISDVAEYAETNLLEISGTIHKKEPSLLGLLVDKIVEITQKLINREISLIGVPYGFTKIDRMTGGAKSGELVIIAGRPSMGKTALALQIAKNTAQLNNAVGFFSCEMSSDSLVRRYISGVSEYTNVELLNGKCNIDKIVTTTESLLKLGIYIDDTSNISLLELRAKTRKLILKHGIKAIIIDYLQLMKGDGQNREQEVASISRGLKAIAKDFDIAVIALSHINRVSEARGDKRPQLSDLRESGAIEQDADVVFLVYRPAKYGINSIISDGHDISTQGLMIVDIAKNRNGATGDYNLKTNISLTNIYEEDEFKTNIPEGFDDIKPF